MAVPQRPQQPRQRLMKNFNNFLALIIGVSMTLIGCATTGPFKEFADDVQKLKVGMTQAEVEAALGPPQLQGYLDETSCKGCWGFDYRKKNPFGTVYLSVFFKEGRVISWKEWRPALNL